ncbi:hypothetical protein ACWOFR_13855 [Carnobacterium gallinarum]|uniref:hypothetical protein n=1 Tax=Carnobacterium gallinarum TaxID=2749 RepID=UPI000554EFFE|nr:hypothetical protein [Carnobacterium gallinarum]
MDDLSLLAHYDWKYELIEFYDSVAKLSKNKGIELSVKEPAKSRALFASQAIAWIGFIQLPDEE